MREFPPATQSPDLSLPLQPWTSSLKPGGRSLCPLAEIPLSEAIVQGTHTGPSGDGFIPGLSLADDGEDSSKGAHVDSSLASGICR